MSYSFSRALVGGLATLAALGVASSTAQAAQTATLDYKCKFPLIGTQPLSLDIALDIPDSWPAGEPTAPFSITAKASAGGTTAQGLGLVEGLHTIGGVTEAQKPGKGTASRARVELPDGAGLNVRVPIDVEPYTVVPPIPDPLVLNARGVTPSLTLDVEGAAKIMLTELILNLYGHYEDGTPVEGLTTPPTDIDRLPYADIDGDPGTFNVPCKLDPATQNLQLATFELEPPIHTDPCEVFGNCPPPRAPTNVRLAPGSEGQTRLSWDAVAFPGNEPDTGKVEYVVEIDGQVYGTTESTSLDIDVDPAVAHTGSVTARYGPSDPDTSSPVAFTIPAADANQPPSQPGKPYATQITADSIALEWIGSTDDKAVIGYDIYRNGSKVGTTTPIKGFTATGLAPDTAYEFRVEAFDAEGARTSSDPATLRTPGAVAGRQKATIEYRCKFPLIGTVRSTFEFGLDVPDTWPVGEPTGPFAVNVRALFAVQSGLGIVIEGASELESVSDAQSPGKGSALRLSILPPSGAAIAARVPLAYESFSFAPPIPNSWVLNGSGVLPAFTVPQAGTTRISLVAPDLNLRIRTVDGSTVEGFTTPPTDVDRQPYVDVDGDPSTANVPCKVDPAAQNLQLASFDTLGSPVNQPPTKPAGLTAIPAQNSVALSWNASTDPDGTVASYNVFQGADKVATVTGTTATITGLSPDVAYSFSVEAVDDGGAAGPRSEVLNVKTSVPPTTPDTRSYTLAGSVKLATLVRGSLALKGKADLTFGPPANVRTVSGTLDLGQSSGRLVALGFLPVTAKVAFVSSGPATGFFGGFGGSLRLDQKARIKVLEAKLFGAIPLIAGNSCQSKQLTNLRLESPLSFNRAAGGPLNGTFAISDLNGCGALNGLVSPLTAGSGNGISVTLAPKAS